MITGVVTLMLMIATPDLDLKTQGNAFDFTIVQYPMTTLSECKQKAEEYSSDRVFAFCKFNDPKVVD